MQTFLYKMKTLLPLLITLLILPALSAQKVGIMTDHPHSVLHVYGPGQDLHPDGLLMLGNRTGAHLLADFNYFQSYWSDQGTVLNMYLQPHGGNVGVNVPLNYAAFAPLHVFGEGVNNTTYGLAVFGNRVSKHLVMDFDRIQARNNNGPGKLYLQAAGGDIDLAGGTLVVDESASAVGIGNLYPTAPLDIISNGSSATTNAFKIRNSDYHNLLFVRDDGYVGIGTSAPNYDLQVVGNIGLTSKVIHAGDDDTYMQFNVDKLTLNAGGVEFVDITESQGGQDVIRLGDGSDIDINMHGISLHVNGVSGYVGIGTATPDSPLDVNGNVNITEKIIHNLDTDTYLQFTTDRFQLYAGSRRMIDAIEGDVDYVDIAEGTMYVNHTSRNVGIGIYNADTDLHILHGWQGGLTIENDENESWRIASVGDLGLYYNGAYRGNFDENDGDYSSASDLRLKKNIEEMSPVLEKVKLLSPKKYHFKTQEDSAQKSIGFIAQEVLSIFPESVSYNEREDLYALDYNDFAVISIRAIQELTELVQEQQKQIEALRGEVSTLQTEVAR